MLWVFQEPRFLPPNPYFFKQGIIWEQNQYDTRNQLVKLRRMMCGRIYFLTKQYFRKAWLGSPTGNFHGNFFSGKWFIFLKTVFLTIYNHFWAIETHFRPQKLHVRLLCEICLPCYRDPVGFAPKNLKPTGSKEKQESIITWLLKDHCQDFLKNV